MQTLKFSQGNSKLVSGEAIFDLPAGHSCPFAEKCFSKADRITGKIQDGTLTEFRCYAASLEAIFKAPRTNRWNNFDIIKSAGGDAAKIAEIILRDLPSNALVRVHSSGDFFSKSYFSAWLLVAAARPEQIFYAYTKALPFWIQYLKAIPSNFRLNASTGGTHDALIEKHGLKFVQVVYSQKEADSLGLEIDHDDSHAWKSEKSFALLIHGNGPKGSKQSKAYYDRHHKSRVQGKGVN